MPDLMSSLVFSISNQKGGTGKTTLSVNFAAGLSKRGRTLLLDADPQGSAWQWAGMATEEHTYPASVIRAEDDLQYEINRQRQKHQFIVIDCPPTLETETTWAAMSVSDMVLIPVQPSPIDLWASLRLSSAIGRIRNKVNPELKAFIIVNQVEQRNALSRAMQQALAEFEIPSLKGVLRRRAVYRSTALEGVSVFCYGKRGEAAAEEIDSIIEEVLQK